MKKVLLFIFNNIEIGLSGIFFLFMSFAVGAQLITRFIGTSFFYAEEIARFSYIWIAFLCIALAEKQKTHFSVTVFTVFLKGRAEAALEFIVDVICCLTFIFLFYWSLRFLPFTHVTRSPAMELPMTIVSSSLAVGFLLSFIRRLYHAVGHAKQMIKGVNP